MLDFRPDLDTYTPGVLTSCIGFVPTSNGGYGNTYSATTCGYSTALAGDCLGARIVRMPDATPRLFAGSDAAIQEANGSGGWTDRSRASIYTTGSNQWWFVNHGAEVIASNYANETQFATSSGSFADLTNAPKARVFVSQARALLALNYKDASGTAIPNGIAISARGSSTTWTAAPSNDATSILLTQSEGPIIAGASLNDIVVAWKRRSMYVGRYVGGSEKWQFNMLSQHIGCLGQEAWAYTPQGIIFVAERGIYLFDGSVPRPIDFGVRDYIYVTGAFTSYNQGQDCFVTHDSTSRRVFLFFRTAISTFHVFAYNYSTDKWSFANQNNIFGGGMTGFHGAVRDSNYEDLILLGGSSNTKVVGHLAFNQSNVLKNLSGDADSAFTTLSFITTGRVRAATDKTKGMTRLKRILPVWKTEGASSTTAVIAYSNTRGGSTVGSDTVTIGTDKNFDLLRVADNFRTTILADASANYELTDLEYEMEPAGAK